MPTGRRARAHGGFVYIALLIGLAMIGIGLGATAQVWTQTRQREKEQELLFVGNQIRQAITRFYMQSPAAARRFPMSLDELLSDVRTPDHAQRYLRKIYIDPMTNSTNWGEVRLPGGQLVGVYSQSLEAPLKVAGFAMRDKTLVDKTSYSDWVFRSPLPAANPVLAAGQEYTAPGSLGSAGLTPQPAPRNNSPTPSPFLQPPARSR